MGALGKEYLYKILQEEDKDREEYEKELYKNTVGSKIALKSAETAIKMGQSIGLKGKNAGTISAIAGMITPMIASSYAASHAQGLLNTGANWFW